MQPLPYPQSTPTSTPGGYSIPLPFPTNNNGASTATHHYHHYNRPQRQCSSWVCRSTTAMHMGGTTGTLTTAQQHLPQVCSLLLFCLLTIITSVLKSSCWTSQKPETGPDQQQLQPDLVASHGTLANVWLRLRAFQSHTKKLVQTCHNWSFEQTGCTN